MTGSHDLLPEGGSVRAFAEVLGGSLVVRVAVFRPGIAGGASRFSGSAYLGASCGGAFWRLLRTPSAGHGLVADSPDLLPGEAFHLAAERLDRHLAVRYGMVPPREPLSPDELALVASLPGVLKGVSPLALLVMLG